MKQFQSFRLDTNDECLWHEGQRLALTRKAFAVLNHLVEQAGHLVTKEELMEAVWPETFVQEEILKTYCRHRRPACRQGLAKSRKRFGCGGHLQRHHHDRDTNQHF